MLLRKVALPVPVAHKILARLVPPVDVPVGARRYPVSRQILRIGFSTASSELVLGESYNAFPFQIL